VDLNCGRACFSAYLNRGRVYDLLGQYQRALEDFNEAIHLDPSNVDVYNARGLTNYNLNKYQRALEDFNEAIRLNPKNSLAFTMRGNIYKLLGQYQRAIKDCSQAIRLPSQKDLPSIFIPIAYRDRGTSYFKLGQYQHAIDDYTKAINFEPNNPENWKLRARAFGILGFRGDSKYFSQMCYDFRQTCRLGKCKPLREAVKIGLCE